MEIFKKKETIDIKMTEKNPELNQILKNLVRKHFDYMTNPKAEPNKTKKFRKAKSRENS